LVGAISSLSLLCFGGWFFLTGDETYSLVAFSMLDVILAFLMFNWSPSKIFMGDTGVLVIALLLSFFAIHFINVNYLLSENFPFKF
jgi:UDP-N-acetylmuramyl pentapeptide phosphotransferase/UDP-N-acetylglucosamine-1-phosphate transferase